MNKKALLITYYWPPAGGPGVQRWLRFVRHLPSFGVDTVVYTPENPSYPVIDKSLISQIPKDTEIINTKIFEPYQLAEFLNPKSKAYKAGHFENKESQSFLNRIFVYIRGNYFIPDARKFWVKPSVKYLGNYLKTHPTDVLVSTGPPHSMHLIGLKLKERNPNLKWLADFRDPWTQISYHSQLKLSRSAAEKHKKLERKVIQSADVVIATSFTDAENYKKLGAKRVEVITNGFEETDFDFQKSERDSKFRITYSGGLEVARNPVSVWQVLKELNDENLEFSKSLELNFYGKLSEEVEKSITQNQLSNHLKNHGYVSHSASIQGISKSDLLLLTNFPDEKSKGIIPGKIFEYMATQNPIIALGPAAGDVSRILNQTWAGQYFIHSDKAGIKKYIIEVFQKWKLNEKQIQSTAYQNYSGKSLSHNLAQLIKEL